MTTHRISATAPALSLAAACGGALQALYIGAPAAETVAMDPDRACDAEDVAATLAGNEDPFARIVARHESDVARVLWRFTRDAGSLDELVQDTFVEAFTSLGSFDARRPLRPWLRRIAVRVGYRHWKALARSRDRVPFELLGDLPAPEEDLAPQRAAETVHNLLARLAPRDRLVLTLIYLEGCSVAQAAELAGWSPTMVKVQAHRARAKLRRMLAQRTPEGTGT